MSAGAREHEMMARTYTTARLGAAALALCLTLTGCISFGAEPPASLLTLTATAQAAAGSTVSAAPASAIAVLEPGVPQSLNAVRVPVQVNDTEVAYLKDAVWVEKPARLFQRMLAETIRTRTGRLVVDGETPDFAAAVRVQGTLGAFGYDAQTSSVIVRYDAVRAGAGDSVQTRRFEAVVPGVAPEAGPVGRALNQAANTVAGEVAAWISGG